MTNSKKFLHMSKKSSTFALAKVFLRTSRKALRNNILNN